VVLVFIKARASGRGAKALDSETANVIKPRSPLPKGGDETDTPKGDSRGGAPKGGHGNPGSLTGALGMEKKQTSKTQVLETLGKQLPRTVRKGCPPAMGNRGGANS
jgi:hypothetical protein